MARILRMTVGAFAAAGVVAAAIALHEGNSSQDGSLAGDLRQDIDRIDTQLEAMSALGAVRPGITRAESTPSAGSVSPETGESSAPAASAVAEDEVSDGSEPPDYDSEFEEESEDRSWATGAEHEISKTVGSVGVEGVHLESVECRSSQCRLEMSFPDKATYNRAFAELFLVTGQDETKRIAHGGVVAPHLTDNGDEVLHGIMYVSRAETPGDEN